MPTSTLTARGQTNDWPVFCLVGPANEETVAKQTDNRIDRTKALLMELLPLFSGHDKQYIIISVSIPSFFAGDRKNLFLGDGAMVP
jgi:hypothetical protein